ncbi:betaine-aldehyde dehydrogenase [Streptomyces aurantiacus]|uniref:aldehyde dehydrogenase family protein n=1 Tax=Streptomyces aurantiacus TaxID=47760 RepID=UPI00278E0D0D|nr:aldehyde dehydrogenase family protein [Streptomyces aurantiacus]MDQ0778760.1 betaine-aldehyde dehydrogenase [Streptomyces aurantiacus]
MDIYPVSSDEETDNYPIRHVAGCLRGTRQRRRLTMTSTPAGNWIGGQWNFGGEVLESLDPSTGQVIDAFHSAGATEGAAAIAAARTAFDTTDWSRNAESRAQALLDLAGSLERNGEDIATMIARENGKLLWEARAEVRMAAESCKVNAARARLQVFGQAVEQAPGVYWHNVPEAVGVAGVISPWNGPVLLSVRSFAAALAAGCTAVVKLPAQTALVTALLSRTVAETTSLPAGVLNIVTEAADEVAPLLVGSPDVDVVSYTGSTRVGRVVAAHAASTVKRLCLELGGKTPLVIFDDVDVDAILPVLVSSCTFMNGQYCGTGARVLVQRKLADTLRSKLSAALEAIRVGPALDPASQLGPLIDKAAVARVDNIVEQASAYGKVLVRGGVPADPELAGGAFFRPALIEVNDVDAPVVQTEVFGPVQTFEVFDGEADAIRRANATEFGLSASVFSRDEYRVRRVGRELRVANVWLNTWGIGTQLMAGDPVKQSGYGSAAGSAAVETYQHLKRYGAAQPRH